MCYENSVYVKSDKVISTSGNGVTIFRFITKVARACIVASAYMVAVIFLALRLPLLPLIFWLPWLLLPKLQMFVRLPRFSM